jgi:predicted DNA-binding transcriptional regulator AlpA
MTKPHDDDQPPPVFIDLARVMGMTGRSKSSIYEDPTFPQPVSFSEPGRARRHARWLLHEVEGWLQERIAERDAKAVQRRQQLLAQRERRLLKRRLTTKRGAAAAASV